MSSVPPAVAIGAVRLVDDERVVELRDLQGVALPLRVERRHLVSS